MEFLLLVGVLAVLGLGVLGLVGVRQHQRAGTVRALLAPRTGSARRTDSDEGAAGAAG
jgi:hypothetical protein